MDVALNAEQKDFHCRTPLAVRLTHLRDHSQGLPDTVPPHDTAVCTEISQAQSLRHSHTSSAQPSTQLYCPPAPKQQGRSPGPRTVLSGGSEVLPPPAEPCSDPACPPHTPAPHKHSAAGPERSAGGQPQHAVPAGPHHLAADSAASPRSVMLCRREGLRHLYL